MGRKPQTWSISQLAKAAAVNIETIRYYERIGMLRQPRKPARGWRKYDESALRRIRFIKRTQELGFTLAEASDLLALRGSTSPRTCERVRKKASDKIKHIDEKIRDLQAVRGVLSELAGACAQDGTGGKCPILDALDPL